jgi:protein involved in polysaccharide export with SLBB domain
MMASGKRRWMAGLVALCLAASGCQGFFAPVSPVPVSPQPPPPTSDVPRELDKVTLPPYVIEPPDILLIDAVKLIPKPPHYLEPLDVLAIRAPGAFATEQISGLYIIDPSGRVELGAAYGAVEVAGLTVEEASSAIEQHLQNILASPQVSVSLASSAISQQISGQHLVKSDGRINLGVYGTVYVAGMTIDEVTAAIETHLSRWLQDPEVVVDIFTFNSKTYWIVTEGAGFGDNVAVRPITGGETVMDAVASIGGISRLSSERMYIARPAPDGSCKQILEVEWDGIKNGVSATNYQLLPGDRLVIVEDRVQAIDSWISRVTRPWERIFGFTLLGSQSLQRLEGFGNDGRQQ